MFRNLFKACVNAFLVGKIHLHKLLDSFHRALIEVECVNLRTKIDEHFRSSLAHAAGCACDDAYFSIVSKVVFHNCFFLRL